MTFSIRPLNAGPSAPATPETAPGQGAARVSAASRRAVARAVGERFVTRPVGVAAAVRGFSRRAESVIRTPGDLSVQRLALAPDDAVTYVRDASRSVVGRFESVMANGEGPAWARDGKFWTVISRDGRQQTVVDLGPDAVPEAFHDGIAAVRSGGRWGAVDQDGQVVAPFEHWDAQAATEAARAGVADGAGMAA